MRNADAHKILAFASTIHELKRIVLLAVTLIIAIAALVVTFLWYIDYYQSGNSSVSGMMGQMMGNQGTHTRAMPQSILAFLIFIIALAVVAVGGIAYYALVPEIKTEPVSSPRVQPIRGGEIVSNTSEQAKPEEKPSGKEVSWPVLMRTSTPEEERSSMSSLPTVESTFRNSS